MLTSKESSRYTVHRTWGMFSCIATLDSNTAELGYYFLLLCKYGGLTLQLLTSLLSFPNSMTIINSNAITQSKS